METTSGMRQITECPDRQGAEGACCIYALLVLGGANHTRA